MKTLEQQMNERVITALQERGYSVTKNGDEYLAVDGEAGDFTISQEDKEIVVETAGRYTFRWNENNWVGSLLYWIDI